MSSIKEIEDYRRFTGPAEMSKSANLLIGLLEGIAADGIIDEAETTELKNWYDLHRPLIDRHPFSELLPAIDAALADQVLELDEVEDLIWLCRRMSEGGYYDIVTAAMQQLHGILHGVMANGRLTDAELSTLCAWLVEHRDLQGSYPFDEIHSLLAAVTADGVVTDEERDLLRAFFSQFIDLRESNNLHEPEMAALREQYSVQGICAHEPHFCICGHTFCFTGISTRAKRADIAEQVNALGGTFTNTLTLTTEFLVVGADGNPCWAFSCYGRKIEKAMNLRKEGSHILLINEHDFWAAVENGGILCPTNS